MFTSKIGMKYAFVEIQHTKNWASVYCLSIRGCAYVNSIWREDWHRFHIKTRWWNRLTISERTSRGCIKSGEREEGVWYFVMVRLKTDTFDFFFFYVFCYWSRLVRHKEVILEFLCNTGQRYWTDDGTNKLCILKCMRSRYAKMKFLFPHFRSGL